MTTPDPKMLDRVRALFAKAAITDFPEEADTCSKMAMKLMAKHGIDQAMLAVKREARDVVTTVTFDIEAPFVLQKLILLDRIASALGCKVIRTKSRATVFGYASDLEVVQVLFSSLLLQAAHGVMRQRVTPGEKTVTFRIAWMVTFANTVGERLAAAHRAAQAEAEQEHVGQSVALVLAGRSTQVEVAVIKAHPKLRKGSPVKIRGTGVQYGRAAGQRADIGGARVSGSGRRALAR